MNKVGRVKFFWLLLAVAIVSLFPFEKSHAEGVSFGQGILPVKFVYLNAQGEIERTWSNVTPGDSAYAVKFFDAKNEKELSDKKEFLEKYEEYIEGQKKCEFFSDGKTNRTVEYNKKGRVFEEVQTVA